MNTQIVILIRRAYSLLVKVASLFQCPLLLIIRLYWGWQFFETGKGKLGDIPKVAGFFKSLGIPFPTLNAYMAGTTECVGGLLLLLGVATRLVSIPLMFVLLIAYVTADNEALRSIFSDPDKFVTATPFLFLFAVVVVFVFGPGLFSVDGLLKKYWAPARETTAATSSTPQ